VQQGKGIALNSAGHIALVLKINSTIGELFDQQRLKDGAVDPDTKVYDSYRGDEYKHHFDDVHPGARLNDTGVINRVVWRRLEECRRSWLSQSVPMASFHFGVASHFLADGLILSPAVSEDEHERGDHTFSRKARTLKPLAVGRPGATGTRYVSAQIRAVSQYYGRTNAADLERAYEALVRMALAVTDPPIPHEVSDLIDSRAERLSASVLLSKEQLLSCLDGLPASVKGRAEALIDRSSFLRRSLAIASALRRSPGWHFSPGAALGTLLCRIHLNSRVRAAQRDAFRRYDNDRKEALGSCQSEVTRAMSPWTNDSWYAVDRYKGSTRRRLQQVSNGAGHEVQQAMQSTRVALKSAVSDAWSHLMVRAVQDLRDLWPGSLQDRLGCFCRANPGTRLILLVLPLFVPYAVAVWLASTGRCSLAAMVATCAALCGLFLWRFAGYCETVSNAVRIHMARRSAMKRRRSQNSTGKTADVRSPRDNRPSPP